MQMSVNSDVFIIAADSLEWGRGWDTLRKNRGSGDSESCTGTRQVVSIRPYYVLRTIRSSQVYQMPSASARCVYYWGRLHGCVWVRDPWSAEGGQASRHYPPQITAGRLYICTRIALLQSGCDIWRSSCKVCFTGGRRWPPCKL